MSIFRGHYSATTPRVRNGPEACCSRAGHTGGDASSCAVGGQVLGEVLPLRPASAQKTTTARTFDVLKTEKNADLQLN